MQALFRISTWITHCSSWTCITTTTTPSTFISIIIISFIKAPWNILYICRIPTTF